jgi:flagellar biosynthesis protein FlhG
MNPQDQAAGLRELLLPRVPRLVSIVSCRPATGRTTLAVNLAAGLARQGHRVVLIDESSGIGNACEVLGLRPRCELADVLNGDRALHEVVLHGPYGITVVPAARGLPMSGCAQGQELIARAPLDRLLARADFVLVDAARGSVGALVLPVPAAKSAIVTTLTGVQMVKQTYAWIKDLASRFPGLDLGVAVCRVKHEKDAHTICANLAAVAERHLGVRLETVGIVAEDHRVADTARAGSVLLEAFPRSRAAVQLRSLAAQIQSRGDSSAGALCRRAGPGAAGEAAAAAV